MTGAKAQNVSSAIINAGFHAEAFKQPDGVWVVVARSNAFDVPLSSASALEAAQNVTATVKEVQFI